MTKEHWDGDSFRRGLIQQAESANRDADQHADRLRTGRSTGSASIRDQYRGETELYDYLSTSAATETPSALGRELDSLEEGNPENDFNGDKKSFRKGYNAAIARIREHLKDYI